MLVSGVILSKLLSKS